MSPSAAGPSICAIISTYNRASLLRECLGSLLGQTRRLNEIIVVNDGSTDDTDEVVRSFGDCILLINKLNEGKSSALNLALRQAQSDYIWIFDDDDIAYPDAIESFSQQIYNDRSIDCIIGRSSSFSDEKSIRTFSISDCRIQDHEPNLHIQFLEEMLKSLNAMLIKKTVYSKIGPFQEDLIRSQDYEMVLRILRDSNTVHIPNLIFSIRVHHGIRGSANNKIEYNSKLTTQLEFDKLIFSKIRADYPLKFFIPTFALHWDYHRSTRAALLQRAMIYAKHEMWDLTCDDLRTAQKLDPSSASPDEIRLIRRVAKKISPWEWRLLYIQLDWLENIRSCLNVNAFGKLMVQMACRPLVGHARYSLQKGNINDVILMSRMLLWILGISGTTSRIISSIMH